MTRSQALDKLRELGDQRPDEDILKFCAFTGIREEDFDGILETFRDRSIWSREGGTWKIRDFLIPDWRWR
jgi:hypothetical protein